WRTMVICLLRSTGNVAHNGASLRPYALCAGEFRVPEDFDAPLPDEILMLICQALQHGLAIASVDNAVRAYSAHVPVIP
ncbi:MAG TPA: hypothetical protein VJ793_17585, partial [Anaerolineae bacterium]|nr:hypothetical protein [Anaerolineae bacterium]